ARRPSVADHAVRFAMAGKVEGCGCRLPRRPLARRLPFVPPHRVVLHPGQVEASAASFFEVMIEEREHLLVEREGRVADVELAGNEVLVFGYAVEPAM